MTRTETKEKKQKRTKNDHNFKSSITSIATHIYIQTELFFIQINLFVISSFLFQ